MNYASIVPILTGSVIISLLHALIPNHWLPVLAIGRKEGWTLSETSAITLLTGFAHVLSTVLIGLLLGMLGAELQDSIEQFTHVVAPTILILMGFYFIRQHYQHHHFHVHKQQVEGRSKKKIVIALALAMFLSPCMEIESYFLLAGTEGYGFLLIVSAMYAIISLGGMLIWVRIAYKGALKLNWHALEHNAGIITGIVLILTGLISFFVA